MGGSSRLSVDWGRQTCRLTCILKIRRDLFNQIHYLLNMIKTTPFTKLNLIKSGMYLIYGKDGQFVARFKHKGPVTMAQFQKELIANHTPEEYFGLLNHPDYSQRKAPLEILKEKNPTWYEGLKAAWMAKF